MGPVIVPEHASVVWRSALSKFRVLGSQTPAGFVEKRSHVPDTDAIKTCAIFADVLRATTTLIAATAAGCAGIYVDTKPASGEFLFERPPNIHDVGEWVFGGELNGRAVEGLDHEGRTVQGVIGNSPLSVLPKSFDGRLLRFFSTNGSRTLRELASARLQAVFALGMANIETTVNAVLAQRPDRVWLSCGGFYGSSSLEDSVACGMVAAQLIQQGFAGEDQFDDDALHMLYLARRFVRPAGLDADRLVATLRARQVPRLLDEIGHADDIPACVTGQGMLGSLWSDMTTVRLVLASPTEPYLRSAAA